MPYLNTYATSTSIPKPATINPGGICSIKFWLWEDTDQWPAINPATGKIEDNLVLKPGKSIYYIEFTETERTLKEEPQESPAGPFYNITAAGRLGGNTNNATLAIGKYQHHQFGLLIKDRNGEQRLIGNEETGARLKADYTSGDISENRTRNFQFTWQSPQPCPIYHDGGIAGTPTSCSQYYLVDRFRVGAPGAPMVDGNTTYTNAALANQNFLLYADGVYIIQVTDNPLQRYCSKPFSGTTITFNGAVVTDEVIEIWRAL